MRAVKFQTVIEDDQVIRIPPGFAVPAGEAEVIVLQPEENGAAAQPKQPGHDTSTSEEHPFDLLLKDAEELRIDDLPEDWSENHDHYIHGTPKQGHQT